MKNLEATLPQNAGLAGKYLTFTLGRESYALAVLRIREIIRLVNITPVPQMPPHLKGVVNLRGKIIPVMDLRLKFQLAETDVSERTCIVVVQVALRAGTPTLMGFIVDGVEEVANISANEIEPTPDFGSALNTGYILGMAKLKGGVKTLLDIDKVVAAESVDRLEAIAA